MDEVEDLVQAGVRSTNDIGEGNRSMRWSACPEWFERSHLGESSEIRQATRCHQRLRDPGIETIKCHYQNTASEACVGTCAGSIAGREDSHSGGRGDQFYKFTTFHGTISLGKGDSKRLARAPGHCSNDSCWHETAGGMARSFQPSRTSDRPSM